MPPPAGTPPTISDHELLAVIGRGSYSEVWLARSVMGASRAVKIVRREAFDDDRPFEREFAAIQNYEPVSRRADGLVNVLHVGRAEDDACFYYVMELADDATAGGDACVPRTLRAEMKARGRLPIADCRAIAHALARALAQLHTAGLVHRDIKPSNIIFVRGAVKLADIGLVAGLGESRSFVGTEGYIPPEGPGTPEADVFSLGRVLYEIATGFDRHEYPKLPPEWIAENDSAALEFFEFVLRACEGGAKRRYATAEALCAD